MNAERLELISGTILDDLDESKLLNHINNVVGGLNNLINENNEQRQNELNNHLVELFKILENKEYFQYPRTWRSELSSLEVYDLLGSQLKVRVERSLEEHKLTPVTARDELQNIHRRLKELRGAFEQIRDAFGVIGVYGDGPEAGAAELSILMPRIAINSEFEKFGKEVELFNKTIALFSELATGSREAPTIKQLSTSEFWLLLALNPLTLLAYLRVVEKLMALRIQTHELRAMKAEADKKEAGAKVAEAFQERIDELKDVGIGELAGWLFDEYKPKKERTAALKKEAEWLLPELAQRIDDSYQIDGDVGEPDGSDDEDNGEFGAELAETVASIRTVADNIRYIEQPDQPVLQLEANDPEAAEDEVDAADEG